MYVCQYMESIRALIRAVSRHEKDILRMSDENIFALSFIQAQRMRPSSQVYIPRHLTLCAAFSRAI